MNKKLFITEIPNKESNTEWYLSYEKPLFQGGETIRIDEKTANALLSIHELLDYVERWNKGDEDIEIAECVSKIANLI